VPISNTCAPAAIDAETFRGSAGKSGADESILWALCSGVALSEFFSPENMEQIFGNRQTIA
jgi:hypothetical protein